MGESANIGLSHLSSTGITTLGFQMVSVGKTKFLEFVTSVISSSAPSWTPKEKRWLHNNNNHTYNGNGAAPDDATIQKNDPTKLSSSINLPEFTLSDVSFHDTTLDCWVIVYDLVYNITPFLEEHPGGAELILDYAGRDATLAFKSVGHSKTAEDSLKPFRVGILVEEDRIWSGMRMRRLEIEK